MSFISDRILSLTVYCHLPYIISDRILSLTVYCHLPYLFSDRIVARCIFHLPYMISDSILSLSVYSVGFTIVLGCAYAYGLVGQGGSSSYQIIFAYVVQFELNFKAFCFGEIPDIIIRVDSLLECATKQAVMTVGQ